MNRPVAFVTGASGFIGRRLLPVLLDRGYAVRALVRDPQKLKLDHGSRENLEVVQGDCLLSGLWEKGVRGADFVFHLAGVTKARHPSEYQKGNVDAVHSLFRVVLNSGGGPKRVVHVSSLAAMGPSHGPEPPESFPSPRPVTRYGRTKLLGEVAARAYGDRVPLTIVRPPVVFGPGDTDVLKFFRSVSRGVIPVVGHDGKLFSLVYADDLAKGMVDAAESPSAEGKSYFLCYPEPLRWSEFGAIAAEAMGRQCRTLRLPLWAARAAAFFSECASRVSGKPTILNLEKTKEIACDYWVCSSERARSDFGYSESGDVAWAVGKTVAWYADRGFLRAMG